MNCHEHDTVKSKHGKLVSLLILIILLLFLIRLTDQESEENHNFTLKKKTEIF